MPTETGQGEQESDPQIETATPGRRAEPRTARTGAGSPARGPVRANHLAGAAPAGRRTARTRRSSRATPPAGLRSTHRAEVASGCDGEGQRIFEGFSRSIRTGTIDDRADVRTTTACRREPPHRAPTRRGSGRRERQDRAMNGAPTGPMPANRSARRASRRARSAPRTAATATSGRERTRREARDPRAKGPADRVCAAAEPRRARPTIHERERHDDVRHVATGLVAPMPSSSRSTSEDDQSQREQRR